MSRRAGTSDAPRRLFEGPSDRSAVTNVLFPRHRVSTPLVPDRWGAPRLDEVAVGYREGMGRGARATVRWKHDRIRRKKLRVKRKAATRATNVTAAETGTDASRGA